MLGSMLVWPEEVIGEFVEAGVSEAWFYRRAHATIYSVLIESWSAQKPCDLITLTQILRERKQLDEVGGLAFTTELVSRVSTADDAGYFRRIVGEKYARRQSSL